VAIPSDSAVEVPARRGPEHWALLAAALLGVAALVVLGTLLRPDPRGYGTHEQLGLQPCRMLQWTGVPCPGCGVTTAASLFAHGEVRAALHAQPFGVLCAALIPPFAALALVAHARGRDLGREVRRLGLRAWLWGLALAALVGWAWKIALVRGWVA
jgi:hypothetical protein